MRKAKRPVAALLAAFVLLALAGCTPEDVKELEGTWVYDYSGSRCYTFETDGTCRYETALWSGEVDPNPYIGMYELKNGRITIEAAQQSSGTENDGTQKTGDSFVVRYNYEISGDELRLTLDAGNVPGKYQQQGEMMLFTRKKEFKPLIPVDQYGREKETTTAVTEAGVEIIPR